MALAASVAPDSTASTVAEPAISHSDALPANGGIAESFHSVEKISLLIERQLDRMPQAEKNKLPITGAQGEFIRDMAQMISMQVSGEYLNSWNLWTQAWNIAKSVTGKFAGKRPVSMAMIELTYAVLNGL